MQPGLCAGSITVLGKKNADHRWYRSIDNGHATAAPHPISHREHNVNWKIVNEGDRQWAVSIASIYRHLRHLRCVSAVTEHRTRTPPGRIIWTEAAV